MFVAEVAQDGPASKAGIEARDIITKIQGVAVTNPREIFDAVTAHKPGDTLRVTVRHAEEDKDADVTVTLGANPNDATKAYMGVTTRSLVEMLVPAGPGRDGTPGQHMTRPDKASHRASSGRPRGEVRQLFQSIRWKLAASYSVLVFLSVTLMGTLALYFVQRDVGRQEAGYLKANARAVADQARGFMDPHVRRIALAELAATSAFLGDSRVRILGPEHELLADSGSPGPARTSSSGSSRRASRRSIPGAKAPSPSSCPCRRTRAADS